MKCLDVEPLAQALTRLVPEPPDLEVAQHVGRGLARHGDVPVDLGGGAGLRFRRVLQQVVDRLLPGPAEGVHAGIDHQSCRPERLVGQEAYSVEISGEDTHFVGQALGV